ncbi:MAG TPA: TrbI/VirB10 family protein [Rhizomicrobium sp.]|nr:TrbI/VirB10 family protein [Rhizomicrobium sp.]
MTRLANALATLTLAASALVLTSAAHAQTSPLPSTLSPDQAARVKQLQDQLATLNSNFKTATGQSLFPSPADPNANPPPDTSGTNVEADYAAALKQLSGGAGAPIPTKQPAADAAQATGTATPPPGPREKIPVGYLAQGRLDITVNSDYPGPWRGILDHPIMSIDGTKILFPLGSKVVGRVIQIAGANAAINNRLGLLPTYIVTPSGDAYKIREQSILDELGISGIADQVDYHLGVQLAAIGAFTAVQALPNIISAQGGGASTTTSTNPTPEGNFANQTASQGEQILNRYMSLLPTINVRAGTAFRIFFNEEMLAPVTRPAENFRFTNVGDKRTAP